MIYALDELRRVLFEICKSNNFNVWSEEFINFISKTVSLNDMQEFVDFVNSTVDSLQDMKKSGATYEELVAIIDDGIDEFMETVDEDLPF